MLPGVGTAKMYPKCLEAWRMNIDLGSIYNVMEYLHSQTF